MVIGGGAIGCEVAFHLAESGSPVVVVEVLSEIGARLESMTRKMLLKKLRERGARFMTGCRLTRVEETGVMVQDRNGKEVFLEAERVAIAIGSRSDNTLYDKIKSLGYEIHQIGDCLEPRSAKAAIYEGAVLGRSI